MCVFCELHGRQSIFLFKKFVLTARLSQRPRFQMDRCACKLFPISQHTHTHARTHTHTHTLTGSDGPDFCRPASTEVSYCSNENRDSTSDRSCAVNSICVSECDCWDGTAMRATNTDTFQGNSVEDQGEAAWSYIVHTYSCKSPSVKWYYAWITIMIIIMVCILATL